VRQQKDVRLFFALWPDPVIRAQLQQAAASITLTSGARRVPDFNLHMTLHFIGNVYLEQMTCLQQQAGQVRAAAFSLRIDCQGLFAKPGVGWLGCGHLPSALDDLHHELGVRLSHCGYRPEQRRYHPHVSVARKLTAIDADARFTAIDWPLREFALIESCPLENGVQYRVVERYPLT
jgi:2'-5' RNA ligase